MSKFIRTAVLLAAMHTTRAYVGMPAWAASADQVYNGSAAETGGLRHLRFVTNSSCDLAIADVQVSSSAMSNFGTMITELRQQGFNRPDRKYLVWADTNVFCGIAQ